MPTDPTAITDPFDMLERWFDEATAHEPRVPDATQVATVDADGRPSLRTVLLKEIGPNGLVFYTNLGSRKARDLAHNHNVALLLHWKSLERQVIVQGAAHPVSDAEADAYHATRARGSQLGAWASRQSTALSGPDRLQTRMREATDRFEGRPVPRPPFWSGFRVTVERMELWQGRPDRLHERIVFARTDGGWDRTLLFP